MKGTFFVRRLMMRRQPGIQIRVLFTDLAANGVRMATP